MELTKLSIRQLIQGLSKKQFSAVELARAYVENAKQNRHLNCFITENFQQAVDLAAISDQKIASGNARQLEGIPIGIKDLFCTKDLRTTCASKMLENFVPTYESTVSSKLFEAGAINLGKLNMDEFAMGSANANSYFGKAVNPFKMKDFPQKELTPGGSSGGSAAAVAANSCAAATGSDTGGSIRQPASFTNIVGIKPTYGRASRYGMIAFASSLDQAGILAKDVFDSALLTRIISGFDNRDSTSANLAVPNFESALNSNLKGLKIGIPKEYRVDGMSPEIEKLWQEGAKKLESAGAKLFEISLPHTQYAASVYYVLAPAECSSNLARFDGVRYGFRATSDSSENLSIEQLYEQTRAQGFGAEVKKRILIGTYVLSAGYFEAYYKKAQQVRRLIANDFKQAFLEVDAILTPSTPSAAFPFDGIEKIDPVAMYLNDVFTVPANLAGLPAISVPAGFNSQNLPLGLQIIGKAFDEQTCFNVALAIEQQN